MQVMPLYSQSGAPPWGGPAACKARPQSHLGREVAQADSGMRMSSITGRYTTLTHRYAGCQRKRVETSGWKRAEALCTTKRQCPKGLTPILGLT